MTASKPSSEVHIASVIVHAKAGQSEALFDYLERSPQLDVHADTPEGKQVLTMEGSHYQDLLAHIDAIESLPGVLSCTLVYHEVMSTREADQEMIPLNRRAAHEEAKL